MLQKSNFEWPAEIGNVGGYSIEFTDNIETLREDWEFLQEQGTSFIYQNYDWVRIAYETFEADNIPMIFAGRLNGKIQFIMPFVLVSGTPNKIRWPGGSHANICCALFSKGFLENYQTGLIRYVMALVSKKLPGMSVFHLTNQPYLVGQYENPFLELKHQRSTNLLYDMDLSQGFEAVLKQGNAKRKRKIFRSQVRKAEALGGYELFVPTEPEEIRAHLKAFFEFKEYRFKEMGIENVFADDKTQKFMEQLALLPARENSQTFRMYALKVGDKVRALYGCGIVGDYCQSCVNAVAYDDEFSKESPGEMILYLMVEQLAEQGYQHFDLGVGDERYKRSWCKSHHQLFDVIQAGNKGGLPFAFFRRNLTTLKTSIRNNQFLWEKIKKLRRFKAQLTGKQDK